MCKLANVPRELPRGLCEGWGSPGCIGSDRGHCSVKNRSTKRCVIHSLLKAWGGGG
jgi:hypothetical protein